MSNGNSSFGNFFGGAMGVLLALGLVAMIPVVMLIGLFVGVPILKKAAQRNQQKTIEKKEAEKQIELTKQKDVK